MKEFTLPVLWNGDSDRHFSGRSKIWRSSSASSFEPRTYSTGSSDRDDIAASKLPTKAKEDMTSSLELLNSRNTIVNESFGDSASSKFQIGSCPLQHSDRRGALKNRYRIRC